MCTSYTFIFPNSFFSITLGDGSDIPGSLFIDTAPVTGIDCLLRYYNKRKEEKLSKQTSPNFSSFTTSRSSLTMLNPNESWLPFIYLPCYCLNLNGQPSLELKTKFLYLDCLRLPLTNILQKWHQIIGPFGLQGSNAP